MIYWEFRGEWQRMERDGTYLRECSWCLHLSSGTQVLFTLLDTVPPARFVFSGFIL